jgi:ADP-ribose pyrophosphatase
MTNVIAIEDLGPAAEGEGGFLTLLRRRYRNRYENGEVSRPYVYEYIHRRGYDAVAIALYCVLGGVPHMGYRPGIRVPVYFRSKLALPLPDERQYLFIPEAVAGSLEPRDRGVAGFLARVVAEVEEEAGFSIRPEEIEPLGSGFFPSHGQSSEKVHLCAARVDLSARKDAKGDGSVNESDAPPVIFAPLRDILLACAAGEIEDPKIEVLANRLSTLLGYIPVLGRYARDGEREAQRPFQAAMSRAGFASVRDEKPCPEEKR